MDAVDREAEVLLPRWEWTRRGFVMTSLVTGFALSVHPVSAEAIHTDEAGLEAGEVKVPVKDGTIPAYRAMPDKGGPFPTVLVIQEVFGVQQIRGREAFRVSSIHRRKCGASLVAAALPSPKSRQTRRGPQLPSFALLVSGRTDGLVEADLGVGGLVGRLGQ